MTEKWQRSLSFSIIAHTIDEKQSHTLAVPHKEDHKELKEHKEEKVEAMQRTRARFAKAAAAALAARDGTASSPGTSGTAVGGKTPIEYALKMFNKAKVVGARKVAEVMREATMLALPAVQQCAFIGRLVGRFQTPDSLVMVMEKATRRDLWTLMNDRRGTKLAV
jgi:hypothetical protein